MRSRTKRPEQRGFMSRLLPLLLSTVALTVTSLGSVPLLARTAGAEGWASFAYGQALGSIAAAVVLYGYGVSGPSTIAGADSIERYRVHRESVRLRAALSLPVVGAASLISVALAPSDRTLSLVGCLSTAAAALGSYWYFLGTGQTWVAFWTDAVPRSTGTALGMVSMATGGGALAGAAGILVGAVVASVASHWVARHACKTALDAGEVAAAMRHVSSVRYLLAEGRYAASSSLVSTAYSFLPLVIYGAAGFANTALFALADKVQKQGLTASAPFANAMQSWVPAAVDRRATEVRAKRVTIVALVAVAVAPIAFLVLGQWVMEWLGGGEIPVSGGVAVATGGILGLAFAELVIGRAAVVALSRVDLVSRLSIIGFVVGLGGMVVGAIAAGPIGACLGLCVGLAVRVGPLAAWVLSRRGRTSAKETRA